jgi:HD-GYP domain-containing protein (c-di-GMP phosphodiesterase class II)
MRQHPVIGAEMIKNIPFLAPAMDVVRSHHERWDGKGYPEGLAGETIPLSARIVAVADALDAMTTSRYYRSRLTPDEAFNEVQYCKGSQFDPAVVQAFEYAWDQIRIKLNKSPQSTETNGSSIWMLSKSLKK